MPQRTANRKKDRGPVISIVVVHWNTPALLVGCLESIQDSPPACLAETVVVDCASNTTETAQIVSDFPGVRLIELESNMGYAAGCNAGFAAVSSDIVLFLNADIVVSSGAIDQLGQCFALNPRIGLVAPLLLNGDKSIQSSGYSFPGMMNVVCDLLPVPDRIRSSRLNGRYSPGNRSLPYTVDYALGAALAIRFQALKEIGGWDEYFNMYSEEIDLARRLHAAGWIRLIEPRATMIHYGGASTGQRPEAMQRALWRSRGVYHNRWSSPFQKLALKSAVRLLTRIGEDNSDNRVIRAAFESGLQE